MKTGDIEGGLAVYRDAVKAHPDQVDLRRGYAKVLERSGKVAEAIEGYTEAIRANPQTVEFHEDLAELLERSGRVEESIAEYDRVIDLLTDQLRLKPENWTIRRLGLALLARGKPGEAMA